MKTKAFSFVAALAAAASIVVFVGSLPADEGKKHDHDHDHAHKKELAAPNGGRILHKVEPHLELFVTQKRKVRIVALDEDGKAIPVGDELAVSAIGGDRTNPTRLIFENKNGVLESDTVLPEGNLFPLVVRIKTSPDARAILEKFSMNLNDCPTCDLKEYACTCDHGDHDGHDH